MYKTAILNSLKNSEAFEQFQLPNDYIMFMYIAEERLIFSDIDENSTNYFIVCVTGHTTDLHPGKAFLFHPENAPEKSVCVYWVYLSLDMFTNTKNYFKYNYFDLYNFEDLFLYSIYFVNDSKLIYVNNSYSDKLATFYKMKNGANIKRFIKAFYQFNEEFVSTLTADNLGGSCKYLYHILIMSYIMNNEAITTQTMNKIKNIHNMIIKPEYRLDNDTKQYINTRLALLMSLCK